MLLVLGEEKPCRSNASHVPKACALCLSGSSSLTAVTAGESRKGHGLIALPN